MEMSRRCDIFAAGSYYGGFESCGSLVIAADGGLVNLAGCGAEADILIGDYDSTSEPEQPHIKLPCVKDDTDTLAAVRIGLEKGCAEFHIWGGTGGSRSDHTMANIQCVAMLSKKGKRAYLHGDGITVTAVSDGGSIAFSPDKKGYVSVFAYSDICTGVCLKGLKYTMNDGELTNDMPLGCSNEFIGEPSEVSVRTGTLLIYADI